MTKKIIILLLFVLSVLSVYSADDSIVSTYRVHDPNIILSNASQCYKDGFYDISFDLCQAYLENEKQSKKEIDNTGIDARLLLGFSLLQKGDKDDKDRFNVAQHALLEICCDPEKMVHMDNHDLVRIQDYVWRVLAKLYLTQQDRRKSGKCLYNSLAVQYNAYNDIYPYIFPRHRPGQLRCIAYLMNKDKEYRSFMMDSISWLPAEDQSWFLSILLKRAWQQEDSLDALWFLAQHSKILQNPKSENEKIVSAFQLHLQLAKETDQELKIDLNEVSVELLEDHPELADSYSIMWCKNNDVRKYSEYEKIKKSYLEYVARDVLNPNRIVFVAIFQNQVVGKGLLRKLLQGGSVQYVGLNMFIDENYKQKRIGARLAETMLLYAQKKWQAE